MDVSLSPLWIFIGISSIVEGHWWGIFAIVAGIAFGFTAFLKYGAHQSKEAKR